GSAFADEKGAKAITFEDPFRGAYKKLLFDPEGTRLLGGILVGDASEYATLSALAKSGKTLTASPADLMRVGSPNSILSTEYSVLPDDAQICSCNNVSKGGICASIREKNLGSIDEVKKCTKAGTGCGGCLPLVTDIFRAELKTSGRKVNDALCEHFAFTRQELFQIVKIKAIKSFGELIAG